MTISKKISISLLCLLSSGIYKTMERPRRRISPSVKFLAKVRQLTPEQIRAMGRSEIYYMVKKTAGICPLTGPQLQALVGEEQLYKLWQILGCCDKISDSQIMALSAEQAGIIEKSIYKHVLSPEQGLLLHTIAQGQQYAWQDDNFANLAQQIDTRVATLFSEKMTRYTLEKILTERMAAREAQVNELIQVKETEIENERREEQQRELGQGNHVAIVQTIRPKEQPAAIPSEELDKHKDAYLQGHQSKVVQKVYEEIAKNAAKKIAEKKAWVDAAVQQLAIEQQKPLAVATLPNMVTNLNLLPKGLLK